MKKYLFIVLLVGLGFSQNYNLNQYVLSSSAINSTNGQQALTGILGQSIVGESQNSNNILYSGFWGYISYGFLEADEPIIPKEFQVSNSYPNPFNPKTTISYQLNSAGTVQISIFDLTGQRVLKLYDGFQIAGEYSLNFSAENLSSGIYFVKSTFENESGKTIQTIKLNLLK